MAWRLLQVGGPPDLFLLQSRNESGTEGGGRILRRRAVGHHAFDTKRRNPVRRTCCDHAGGSSRKPSPRIGLRRRRRSTLTTLQSAGWLDSSSAKASALKEEDRREQWYEDWIAYQAEHRLTPACSRRGSIRRWARVRSAEVRAVPRGLRLLQSRPRVQPSGLVPRAVRDPDGHQRRPEAGGGRRAGGRRAARVRRLGEASRLRPARQRVHRRPRRARAVSSPTATKYYIGNANAAVDHLDPARRRTIASRRRPATSGAVRPVRAAPAAVARASATCERSARSACGRRSSASSRSRITSCRETRRHRRGPRARGTRSSAR